MKKNYLDIFLITCLAFYFSLGVTWDSYASFNYIIFSIIFMFSEILLLFLFPKIKNWNLKEKNNIIKKREFIVYGSIIVGVFTFLLIAYFPGVIFPDTFEQWKQVQSNIYTNWHPLLHTLIFLKLPSLFYNNIFSAVIFQLIFIGLIILYFCYFLRKNYFNFYETIIILLLFLGNPALYKFLVCPYKDLPYSFLILLVTMFLIAIVKSNGEWLKPLRRKIYFILATLGILIFRHNGIVPFALTFISLIIFYPKLRKFTSISLVIILSSWFIFTGPIFKLLNISSSGGKIEMIGIPLGQLSYYYHNNAPFEKEELEVMNDLIKLNYWNEYYNPRNFNYVKWKSEDYVTLANKNFTKLLTIWKDKTLENPAMFVKSYLNMTSPIWDIKESFAEVDYEMYDYTTELSLKGNMANISSKFYEQLVNYNKTITSSPLRWLFLNYGQALFIIVGSLTIIISKTKWNLKRLIPFVPVITNSLAIMLLITGEEYRFVYSQILCALPLMFYALYERITNKKCHNL